MSILGGLLLGAVTKALSGSKSNGGNSGGQSGGSYANAFRSLLGGSGNGGGSTGGGSTGGGYTGVGSGGTYTIGSDRGKNFIDNAAAGSTIIGGDGSKWTKNSDGVTTIEQNGNIYTVGPSDNYLTQQARYQQELANQRRQAEELQQEMRGLYDGQQSQYAQALAQQRAAQEAAVNRVVNGLEGQKDDVNAAYSNIYRQAYIDKMNAQKDLNQRLAAQGITGGAAESTMLGLNTSYAEALRKSEQEKAGALGDLDRAITDARLTGDIESANATAAAIREQTDKNAEILQNLINRYDTLTARQQAYDREDAQRAEAYGRTDTENSQAWARNLALQMINSGNMPDDDTLTAAGMSRAQAQALLPQTESYTPTFSQAQVLNAEKQGTVSGAMLRDYNWYMYGDPDYSDAGYTTPLGGTGSSSGGSSGGGSRRSVSYNNSGLPNSTVAEIQRAYGFADDDIDGYWGPNSYRLTGYESAQAALDALKAVAAGGGNESGAGMMSSSAALNAAVANASTIEGQILYLNQLLENGSISRTQFNDLANSLTGPRYK